jgi:hypothetical protein
MGMSVPFFSSRDGCVDRPVDCASRSESWAETGKQQTAVSSAVEKKSLTDFISHIHSVYDESDLEDCSCF